MMLQVNSVVVDEKNLFAETASQQNINYLVEVSKFKSLNTIEMEPVSAVFSGDALPFITGIATDLADGTYGQGVFMEIKVSFSENIVVSGNPNLVLNSGAGARAEYTSGGNSNILIFTYNPLSGEETPLLDYAGDDSFVLASGSIKDITGNNAEIKLPVPGQAGSFSANKMIAIDTIPPDAAISYSNSALTNADVVASISASEAIVITNNNGLADYSFVANDSFTFEYIDSFGNVGSKATNVNWIDKVAPTAIVSYNPAGATTASVIATITPSEMVTITNNGGLNSYTFSNNDAFTFNFVDSAGNAGFALATVNWISPVTVSFAAVSQASAGESGTLEIGVQLNGVSGNDVTIPYSINAATTANTADYSVLAGPLIIPAGNTSGNIAINLINDIMYEGNETIIVDMGTPINAVKGAISSHSITISEDDPLPSLAISGNSLAENGGSQNISVVMTGTSSTTTTVNYSTTDGTATVLDGDYNASSGTLTWNPGESGAKTFSITVNDDSKYEANETVNLSISSPVGAAISSGSAILTINNNDPQPSLAIQDNTVSESTGSADITVTMTGLSAFAVAVDYTTADSTAAVSANDYTAAGGTLVWNPGETGAKTFSVTINDDSLEEFTETVNLYLSNQSNATISTGFATLTINDNDTSVPLITQAETMDSNGNGRIDHYKITVSENIQDSSFPGYISNSLGSVQSNWLVSGYINVRLAHGSAAPAADTNNDNIIYVKFDESGASDSGAKPDLTTTATPGLQDIFGNTIAQVITATVTELDKALPVITAATSLDNTKVRATFSESILASSAECASTISCSAIYSIAGSGGLNVNSALMTGGSGVNGNMVDLTTDSQLQGSDNYTITIIAGVAQDLAGNGIGSANNSALFSGTAANPKLLGASATNNTTVTLTFSDPVTQASSECASAAACSAIYSINGLAVNSAANATSSASVVLTTSAQTTSVVNGYTVTVTSGVVTKVADASTCVSPFNFKSFTGDILPYLISVVSVDSMNVDVAFSEAVQWDSAANGALLSANYSIAGGISVSSANAQTANIVVRIITSAQVSGTNYTLTASNIKDGAGNLLGTPNSLTFIGLEKLKIAGGLKLSAHENKFMITFSKNVDSTGGANAANNLNNWYFPSAMGSISFCTSTDTADCPAGGISANKVYFKSATDPIPKGIYTIIGATSGGGFGNGCILPVSGTSPTDCLQAAPKDRTSIPFDPPTNPGDGPVANDPFGSGTTLSGQAFRYNGRLYIGPNNNDTAIFQSEVNFTNATTITLDADASTVNTFESFIGLGGSLSGIDRFYASCAGGGASPYLTGAACSSAGGTEYTFVGGFQTSGNLNSVWYSTNIISPFAYTEITGLNAGPHSFRTSSMQIFNSKLYVALPDGRGNAPRFNYTTVPPGTVVNLSGRELARVGTQVLNTLPGTCNDRNTSAPFNLSTNPGTGSNANQARQIISIDSMAVYDNDDSGNNDNLRLYIGNGGCHDSGEDGGIIRLKISAGGTPPTIATGSGLASDWEDMTPNLSNPNNYWKYDNGNSSSGNSIWSKMMIPYNDDWTNLTPAGTFTPAVKAIPKMVIFNGDLYLIRNACKTPITDSMFGTGGSCELNSAFENLGTKGAGPFCAKTCKSGDEIPQLWRLKSYDEVGSIAGSGDWQFIGNLVSGRTDMGGATWTDGVGQAAKTVNNTEVTLLEVNGNRLYIGFDNSNAGVNIWRTKSGISSPAGENDFEAVCQTGNQCAASASQFGFGDSINNTRIFDSTSVEDAGTYFLILNSGNGSNGLKIFRSANN
jgi:hypothetical protein